MTYFLVYLIGIILSFGIGTWYEIKETEMHPYIQPAYIRSVHNPHVLILSATSWIGVIVLSYSSIKKFKDIGLLFSYKRLWKSWRKRHFDEP